MANSIAHTFLCAKTTRVARTKPVPPPIFTSTNPSHVDIHGLRDLFAAANVSCHRFPNFDTDGRVEPVDADKLRIALAHSSVVVSVFSPPPTFLPFSFPFLPLMRGSSRQWSTPSTTTSGGDGGRQLVGFGRAVSDSGLTASIHDVVVLPSLQGLGIGRRIINSILRVLTNRGIYDISALCSEEERLFFEACGFGDDILLSTTMMYTKVPFGDNIEGGQLVAPAGRKLLLVPPLKKLSHLR